MNEKERNRQTENESERECRRYTHKEKWKALQFDTNKTDRLKIIKIIRFAHNYQLHQLSNRNRIDWNGT